MCEPHAKEAGNNYVKNSFARVSTKFRLARLHDIDALYHITYSNALKLKLVTFPRYEV